MPFCDVAAAANAIVGLVTFRCETPERHYDVHHLERGDVRVYCRARLPGHG